MADAVVRVVIADMPEVKAEIDRIRAALDEANTDRQRLQEIINRQKVTAEERLELRRDRRAARTRRRLIDERDQALATAARWEDRANRLEKSAGPTLNCRQ